MGVMQNNTNQQQNNQQNQGGQNKQAQNQSGQNQKPVQAPVQAPAAKQAEKTAVKQQGNQPRRMGAATKVIGGILIFIVIAWVLSALREKPDGSLVVEDGEGTEVSTSTTPISTGVSASAVSVLDGAFTYTLDGVSFVFEPQAADENGVSTRVRLQINGLKRNGFPIDVARYRMGTYRGTCSELSTGAVSEFAPTALSAASCQFNGMTRQLATSQQGNNLVTQLRTLNEDGEQVEMPVQISSIDITQIVQPSN